MPDFTNIPHPFIRKGDPITADKLNTLAHAARRLALQPGQFQNGRLLLTAPLALASSGSSSSANVATAVVIDEAGASTHSTTGIGGGTIGRCVLLNADGSKSEQGEYDEFAIEFRSKHRTKIPVDTIIELTCEDGDIVPGSVWPDEYAETAQRSVWGKCVDARDELWQYEDAGEMTSLSIPEGANGPEDIKFMGAPCELPES